MKKHCFRVFYPGGCAKVSLNRHRRWFHVWFFRGNNGRYPWMNL